MGTFINLIGKKFGRLVVIQRAENNKHKKITWKCQCDCGKIKIICGQSLTGNVSTSCGCYRKEVCGKNGIIHGLSNTRLYQIWNDMVKRCYNNKHEHYLRYGGRGISICKEWRDDFKAFYYWTMENGYKENLSIDRIDNDGNYEPSNCRWVTQKEQCRNKSTNNIIVAFNDTKTLIEWSEDERCKVGYSTLRDRIRHKWNPELAIISKAILKTDSRKGDRG